MLLTIGQRLQVCIDSFGDLLPLDRIALFPVNNYISDAFSMDIKEERGLPQLNEGNIV